MVLCADHLGVVWGDWSGLSRDTHPAGGNGVVILTVLVIPRKAIGTAVSRGKVDASSGRDVFPEFAAASHVHLQDNHAKEVAVLARLALTRHGRHLWVERVVLVALLLRHHMEVVALVASPARTPISLHLD